MKLKKAGISEILSAILLISLTVLGAVVVFIYLFTSQKANELKDFSILVAEIHVSANSAVFNIEVRNIGTMGISSLTYSLGYNAGSNCASCSGSLLNGTTVTVLYGDQNITRSYFVSWGPSQTPPFTVGNYYVLSISATFVDGSTVTRITSVLAAAV